MRETTKAQLTMLFWLSVVVLYTHIFACLIWWILKVDQLWLSPVDTGAFSLRVYFADEVSMATDLEQ